MHLSQGKSSVRVITVQDKDDALLQGDDTILETIFATLAARLSADPYAWDGAYAMQIRELPVGLRAMAATHDLVVCLSQGDLVWYFRRCGEPNHVQETERGLRKLGLADFAELFRGAYEIIFPHLREIRACGDDLDCLQRARNLDRIAELSREAAKMNATGGEQMSGSAIYAAWIRYARKHHESVFPVE